jgi:FtsZ-binding cell division protein ZapB
MSTDKLQALSNTVAEILSDPPSPPTFFDEEPYDAAKASEQVAKASDNPRPGTRIPNENFGKATSREPGISPKEVAHIVRDAESESPGMARQPAASGKRISLGGWVVRGFAVILLAAGIGTTAIIWLGSTGDAAKKAPSQPAALAQAAPTAAALPPELTPLLQSMARDLASMGKEIEQLKAGRELMARDNAKLSEQLRSSQEQLSRAVAQVSEQLKASQDQLARDNANVAEQMRGMQGQLTSVMSRAPEQNAAPRIAAAPPRPTPPSPRPAPPAVRKPVPTLSSPQATAQPKPEKPKLSSTSTPPAPAR